MGVGSTTSNAESRSEATISNRDPSTRYRSRTLPERRKVAASAGTDGLPGGCDGVEALEDGADMSQRHGVVEHPIELLGIEHRGDLDIRGHEVPERPALIGGAQRGAL